MKRTFAGKAAAVVAAASVFAFAGAVMAQDDEAAGEQASAEETAAVAQPKKQGRLFTTLMRCARADGSVSLLLPRTEKWVAAEVGRMYPLGTEVRVSGTSPNAEFELGEGSSIVATGAAEFATRELEGLSSQVRTVVLRAGVVDVRLPLAMPEGKVSVVAPFFQATNLAGESRFTYAKLADGDEAVVRCVTGTLAVQGRHYKIAKMRAADQIRIRTTGDDLFTSLLGEIGNCKVTLDQGVGTERDFETGAVKEVPRTLEFGLSPQYVVKIFRRKAEVGGRVSVATMTFDQAGVMRNRCAFAEGRSMVNTGELVVAADIPDEDEKKEKAAKDDSEETEETGSEGAKEKDEDSAEEEKSEDAEA